MTLNIIHNMRREVRNLNYLAQVGQLTPERLKALTTSLGAAIDSIENYLEAAVILTAEAERQRGGKPRLAWSRPDPDGPSAA